MYLLLSSLVRNMGSGPEVIKTFHEHEILNAYNYKNIKKFGIFDAQISLKCYFSCS